MARDRLAEAAVPCSRSAMVQTDDITIRPAATAPANLSAYARMLDLVFGEVEKFTPEGLFWRYQDNPAGTVVGADAWAGETLAAHYVTCPTAMTLEGAPARGLLSLNTATHPDYQGRGLFPQLAETTYAAGAEAGFDFVFGVANANSTPGFVRKLGFQLVAPLAAGVLPAPPRKFTPAPVQLAGDWSPAALTWRLDNPTGRYRTAKWGDLSAVWARTHLPVTDCLALLSANLPDQGPSPRPSLYIGLDPRLTLERQLFLPVPQGLRPSPLNLIYRPLSPRAPARLNPREVAISFLDFDPY